MAFQRIFIEDPAWMVWRPLLDQQGLSADLRTDNTISPTAWRVSETQKEAMDPDESSGFFGGKGRGTVTA